MLGNNASTFALKIFAEVVSNWQTHFAAELCTWSHSTVRLSVSCWSMTKNHDIMKHLAENHELICQEQKSVLRSIPINNRLFQTYCISEPPSVSKLLKRSTTVKNLQHLFPVTLEMSFLQPVRLAADRPHVWVSGAGWSWKWLCPNAAAWSSFSVTTKSAWKQISTQVAPTARTCQWGMLDASGNKTRQTSPTTCPSLICPVHSFTLFFPSLSFGSMGSRSVPSAPLGRSKSLRRSVTRLSLSLCPSLSLSLWLSVSVCAVAGRWAVLQSLPNKLVNTHTHRKQTMPINLCEIQAVQTLDSSSSQTCPRIIQNLVLTLIVITKKKKKRLSFSPLHESSTYTWRGKVLWFAARVSVARSVPWKCHLS